MLAGEKGRKIESIVGTALAAAKIYDDSSEIKVNWAYRFFESNEVAMEDIVKCAELEKNLKGNKC
jgi:hypothetical protein